ncbi:TasA family protein [uncultured Modestobacter sp.]|uniref:TasA family protein n=1 Tax=uncultured Modestobacter sp. TaxID=380048 RepID=UPI00260B376F|nr:TasA family protein [uncultured Modestobacter sp.]
MTATATNRSRTTRKIIGSLGIVGAAAAVAGMGTFGTFTDSTAPLNASVTSGTLSLDLAAGGAAGMTINAAGFVPGDSISRSVELVNNGNLNMSSISLVSTATTQSVLTTDKVNGLQLGVDSCSVKWTETIGANGVATYTCSGSTARRYAQGSGAVTAGTSLRDLASMTAGGTDHLLVTVTLPGSADNTFQGKTAAMSINFVGAQQTGTNR